MMYWDDAKAEYMVVYMVVLKQHVYKLAEYFGTWNYGSALNPVTGPPTFIVIPSLNNTNWFIDLIQKSDMKAARGLM